MVRLEQALIDIRSTREAVAFLAALWSRHEVYAVKKRWQAVQLLRDGKTQRIVSYKLQIGIATVTRSARMLRDHKRILETIIGRAS
jgi:uncharacterized protein YerC